MAATGADTVRVGNPHDPGHWMWLQPVQRHLRVYCGGTLLADTVRALRVLEVGHEVLPPVLYLPPDALRVRLAASAAARTHCPLKGEASYHDLAGSGERPAVAAIAWSYDEPIADARALAGWIAFAPERVTFVDAPP